MPIRLRIGTLMCLYTSNTHKAAQDTPWILPTLRGKYNRVMHGLSTKPVWTALTLKPY